MKKTAENYWKGKYDPVVQLWLKPVSSSDGTPFTVNCLRPMESVLTTIFLSFRHSPVNMLYINQQPLSNNH